MADVLPPLLIVRSKLGRDKGRLFVVIGSDTNGRALIVDGDLRKINKPKSKNKAHLKPTGRFALSLAPLIGTNQLQDASVRRAIANATKSATDDMEGITIGEK